MSERSLGTTHAAPLAVSGDVLGECVEAAAAAVQHRVDANHRLDQVGLTRKVERRPHRRRHRHSADVHDIGLIELIWSPRWAMTSTAAKYGEGRTSTPRSHAAVE